MVEQDLPDELKSIIDKAFDAADVTPVEPYTGNAYHYTNSTGLNGILREKSLWLHDIRDMSDRLELIYPIEKIIEAIQSFQEQNRLDSTFKDFLTFLQDGLRSAFGQFGYYAVCFSEDNDKLSQWRAYAADGAGFAAGFKIVSSPAKSMHELPEDITKWTLAFRVNYDLDVIKTNTRCYLDAARVLFNNNEIKKYYETNIESLKSFLIWTSISISGQLITDAVRHKHHKFSEEQEIRLLLCNERVKLEPFVKVREQSARFKSFVTVLLDDDITLTDITVGPAAHEDTPLTLSDLLNEVGLHPYCKIRQSVIPYRP